MVGREATEKHKEKMRAMFLGRVFSSETLQKMRDAKLGGKHTLEHIEKIRITSTGRRHSQEVKDKAGLAKLGDKNPSSKLTSIEVVKIKQLIWVDGIHTSAIAKQFNVAPRTIRDIKNRLCWKEVVCEQEGKVEFAHPNPAIKLNESKVREIKNMISGGKSDKNIGQIYLVSPKTIRDIRRGITWKNVSLIA